MGIDEWMNPSVPRYTPPFCMEDYPGYVHALIQCNSCFQKLEGLFSLAPEEIKCPKCQASGIRIIKQIRKIYLQ